MKLRSLPVAVAAAAALLVPVAGLAPAYADLPAAPGIDTLDSSVAGVVTGTVSSADQPFVLVALVAQSDSGEPTRVAREIAVDATFSFDTWGYGAGTTVQAWACPTATYDAATCSSATISSSFTPTDVAVAPTFSPDTKVGPADDVSVDLGDPGDSGGGLLFGRWVDGNPSPLAPFSVAKTDVTAVPVRDGTGTVHLDRCDNSDRDHCVEVAVSDSYTVKQSTPSASIGAVTGVSDASPATTFDVTTTGAGGGDGSYTVTWHLEKANVTVPGYGDTTDPAFLVGGVAQDVPLDATGLPKGDYTIVGTITVVDDDYGTYSDISMTGGTLHSSGDVTPPAITSIKASPTKIYPLISGNSTDKNTTTITVTGSGLSDSGANVLRIYDKSTGDLVRTRTLQVNGSTGTTTWDGRKSNGDRVRGTFLLKIRDTAGNFSATVGTVSVSGLKLVTKTWTRTFTPAGTLADKYVGKCSTLRKPALRGWYNSLGYYANTRCTSQTAENSLVSTLHAVFLPAAVQYVDIHVNAYGGAARAKPGSKAVIRYLNTNGDWVSEKPMSATLGTHSGYTRSTSGLVFKDRSFGWGVYTGFGYQYDVKSFTIVLHYKVLG